MRVMRLVGFGSICVSAGLGVWACDDDATTSGASPDGGLTPFDSGIADTGFVPSDAGSDAPSEPQWCGSLDGGVQSRCAKHQWDDVEPDAAANCKACPGRALTCADLVRRVDGGTTTLLTPTYDHYGTKTLTIDVPPNAGEIVGGAVTVTHSVCYGAQASDASTFTMQVEVKDNQIRAPLAAYLDDAGTYDAPCGEITYQLVDSCCTQSTVKFETYHDPESSLTYKTSCPDGG